MRFGQSNLYRRWDMPDDTLDGNGAVHLFTMSSLLLCLCVSEDYGKTFEDVTHLINHTFIQTEFGIAISPDHSGKVSLFPHVNAINPKASQHQSAVGRAPPWLVPVCLLSGDPDWSRVRDRGFPTVSLAGLWPHLCPDRSAIRAPHPDAVQPRRLQRTPDSQYHGSSLNDQNLFAEFY